MSVIWGVSPVEDKSHDDFDERRILHFVRFSSSEYTGSSPRGFAGYGWIWVCVLFFLLGYASFLHCSLSLAFLTNGPASRTRGYLYPWIFVLRTVMWSNCSAVRSTKCETEWWVRATGWYYWKPPAFAHNFYKQNIRAYEVVECSTCVKNQYSSSGLAPPSVIHMLIVSVSLSPNYW